MPTSLFAHCGEQKLGVKTEIKNMNSFRSVERALEYEARRQIAVIRDGGTIRQETRGWIETKGITVLQRVKEFADDYRYFPEPDLPPLLISSERVDEIRCSLPELPDGRRARYQSEYGLSEQEANVMTEDKPIGDFFEQVVNLPSVVDRKIRAKAASNWFLAKLCAC